MAKQKKKDRETLPPKNGLPPKWEMNGRTFIIVATDIESNVVTVKDDQDKIFYFNFYDLRDRLNKKGITS